jgi:hypothetical protein
MKKTIQLTLALAILTFASSAWATSVGSEPAKYPGSQQAQITQAPKDLVAVVGTQARVTAVSGNQVTIKSLKDPAKTVTISVSNAGLFKVGQEVSVTQRLLTPLQGSRK